MTFNRSVVEQVRARLLEGEPIGHRREAVPAIHAALRAIDPSATAEVTAQLTDQLVSELIGLGPIEPYLLDPAVTEVMINGDAGAYVERHGRVEAVPLCLDEATRRRLVDRAIAPLGLRVDRASPIVDARLPNGARINAVIPPLALDGTVICIRAFSPRRLDLGDFGATPTVQALMRWMTRAGWNLLVAGGTSSGKTTLLNVLGRSIPPTERIVTIEETAELNLDAPHVVRLEARPPNIEGAGGITVRQLVRTSLRLRPDRIVVGEVRGAEAFDLLVALNTGHDGSLATVHANSTGEALDRVASLVALAGVNVSGEHIRAQIASGIDAVIAVGRRRDGLRQVTEIAEVAGVDHVRALVRAGVVVGTPQRAARRSEVPLFAAENQ